MWSRPALPVPRRPLVWTPVLVPVAVVVVLLGIANAGGTTPSTVDLWLRATALAGPAPSVGTALLIDYLGEPEVALLLVALLAATCLLLRRGRLSILAVAGPGAAITVTTVAKPVVDRRIHAGHLAYPSGHTALLAALGLVVALLLVDLLRAGPALAWVLVACGCTVAGAAMALSQIALDAHYPTDTIGGFGTAVAVVPVTGLLVDRLAEASARRVGPPAPVPGNGA